MRRGGKKKELARKWEEERRLSERRKSGRQREAGKDGGIERQMKEKMRHFHFSHPLPLSHLFLFPRQHADLNHLSISLGPLIRSPGLSLCPSPSYSLSPRLCSVLSSPRSDKRHFYRSAVSYNGHTMQLSPCLEQ